MSFDLVFRNKTEIRKFNELFFKAVLKTAFEVLGVKKNIELSVNLVSQDEILEMNKKFRNVAKVTDVLSFPLGEPKAYDILPLGDIFICPSFAVKKAKDLNISISEEMRGLTVHGLLHLLGYDHDKESKAHKMSKIEKLILNEWENGI